ncbi:hypothetical protein NECAME_09966 [Necator americanus]|uniref:G-protein coupled receptors family 1 profile domain-containing protein n=1 Tax=Necator americanus TaxID=51031 RepID=W2TAU6_NECAM|nr:hypothetical protein NECAME_09966 [Necator americanus]ETN79160.1 hypothetical protein NECAME_09966 [Necator americanus]
MNATQVDCDIMESLATSTKLILMLSIHLICSTISIPILLFTVIKIKNMKLLHPNTRVILLAYILFLGIHSLSRVVLYGTELLRFALPRESGCDVLPSLMRCFIQRLPLNYSMFFIGSSPFMISIERSISTIKISKYEENRAIGPILVVSQV